MYPLRRLTTELIFHRYSPRLAVTDTHVTKITIMPWDIDLFMELNNGRTLTLYDLGRFGMFHRMGVTRIMAKKGWSAAVAGASVRYRKRVRMFDRIEIRSRFLGYDDKFNYIEQSMWRGETCVSHILVRSAVTDRDGIVPSERVAAALEVTDPMTIPAWAQNWIGAEATRPWPPERI